MKILIIEDEVKTVQSLKKGLEEHQMTVEFAHDGLSGLQLAETGQFDVVISDVVMPKMTGFELVKNLRLAGVETPVLFLTAMGTTDDQSAFADGGEQRIAVSVGKEVTAFAGTLKNLERVVVFVGGGVLCVLRVLRVLRERGGGKGCEGNQ